MNNILAGITGNIYLAKQQEQMPPDSIDNLNTAEGLSFRAANLIQQLLTFARKDKVSMQALPFTPFLKETMKFLRSSIPENITVNQDIPDNNPMIVRGDPTQIHQVLMNLINNARDALEEVENPHINIRLETLHADLKFRHAYPQARHDSYAHLSIADNGCGIPDHAINHLFEPFFTTKEPGKGTGLGLAMVFGAVQTHGGFVDVESIPTGKGSEFHIYLPIEEVSEMTPELTQEAQPEVGHGETILLVDDEAYVIETGKEVLESLGYQVLTAHDGMEAVDLFRANKERVALVIMDVVMPKMSGAKAAGQIRQIAPDAKVLFCSGYDKEATLPRDLSSDDATIFLSKPYNVETLSKLIRKQLKS
ncbi:ATP-binding protein [Mariprofundus ferrooxydans]|uniref:hybrid sensor histidine kinase/response regulator n=1 Tax=Mariprofundus ferrooxydans TaxID=314344 RepID=UPI000382D413|nr:ATP-binding protein [Mariprofundus ferrooxydans]